MLDMRFAKVMAWIVGVVVIVPMLLTVYFYISGLERTGQGTTSDIMRYAFRLDGKRLDLFDKPANEKQ